MNGTVTDGATGETLPGANVSVQGTQIGTTTNAQGRYELTVPGPNVTLVFSFIGYQSKEVDVGEQTTINVTLQEEVGQLEEVVVTGYSQQQRQEITGSVSSVDVAEAAAGQNASAQELLKGRVSGLSVLENSGEPGSGVDVRIRGTTSISAGSSPLYVIDGVPISTTTITPSGAGAGFGGDTRASSSSNPLSLINPQDIKSIQVLKDAAATAIYGSQGANGVILIETEGGESGGVRVDYSGQVSLGTVANELDLLSASEYREAAGGGDGDVSTDWQDETLRNAVTHEHNLSLSGGNESTTYRASLGYLDNEGLLIENGIQRVSGRVNAQHETLNDRLRFNLNLTASYLQREHGYFRQGGGFQAGVIGSMIAFLPTVPVRNQDGQFAEFSDNFRNPVALQERIVDVTDQDRILGNFSAEADLLENLTLKGTLGLDVQDAIRRSYIPGSGPPRWLGVTSTNQGLGRQAERNLSSVVTQSTIDYSREVVDGQRFKFLGGFEYKRETFQELEIQSQNFITDANLFNNLDGGIDPQPPASEKALVEQVSFFGRVNYNIDNKYLLEATLRRDGSSVFGDNEKFGFFPAASVGWNVANEDFLDVEGLAQLKLRFSWGLSGNQAVPPYESLPALTSQPSFNSPFGDNQNSQPGVAQERAPNPDLKWEQTEEFNLGLDFTYGRFDGSINAYQKTTSDLLVDIRIPQPAPSEFQLSNVGNVENRGVEFNVEAFIFEQEDMNLSVGANVSTNHNEITDLGNRAFIDHTQVSGPGQTGVDAQRLAEGHPIGAFYGPKFVGTNENNQELYAVEGGEPTTDNTAATPQFIGNPIPDFSYGVNANFRYERFDASLFIRGEQGREIFNNTALEFQYQSKVGTSNILRSALNDGVAASQTPTYSSRWIQDASYVRLSSLTIGYKLPTEPLGLRRARVYASGQNLITLTPYDGYDPEVNTNVTGRGLGFRTLERPTRGVDYTSYPRPRTFTLGVQIGL